jgi:hypothetical protein
MMNGAAQRIANGIGIAQRKLLGANRCIDHRKVLDASG